MAEISSYILRAVLARVDEDNEGAALVGTSEKENLGGATTVEQALRYLDQYAADPSGLNSTFAHLIGLGQSLEPQAPIAGAGILVTPSSPVPRIDAKGNIGAGTVDGSNATIDYADVNTATLVLAGNYVLAVTNVRVGQRFALKLKQDGTGGRDVSWWSTIHWAGGEEPSITQDANKADWFGFIHVEEGVYDGFVIGANI